MDKAMDKTLTDKAIVKFLYSHGTPNLSKLTGMLICPTHPPGGVGAGGGPPELRLGAAVAEVELLTDQSDHAEAEEWKPSRSRPRRGPP